jgi:hypothetical protein
VNPVTPLPAAGEVFLDTRGSGRALLVSWHHLGPDEGDLVVLSLWSGNTCTGTFRIAVSDVPDLVDALRLGLARSFDSQRDGALRSETPGRGLTG